jgi:uncharacterized protein (TIGR00106 family)
LKAKTEIIMAILQLTIIPIGTANASLGNYIARIQQRLTDMGALFTLTDMGTLLEGEIPELLRIVGAVYETPFEDGAMRVVTQITIDDRRDKSIRIGDKTQSVLNILSPSTPLKP